MEASWRRGPREESQVRIRGGALRPDETGRQGQQYGKGQGLQRGGEVGLVWGPPRGPWHGGLCLLHQALGSLGRFLSRGGS